MPIKIYYWQNICTSTAIHILISFSISVEGDVGAIQKAIDKFNAVTCLHYVHVEEAPVDSRELLVFNRTKEGWCRMHELRNISSGVRYVVLTLHVTCLKKRVEHMMMHALGFLHEHQRSDRDCYVEVESTQGQLLLTVNQV